MSAHSYNGADHKQDRADGCLLCDLNDQRAEIVRLRQLLLNIEVLCGDDQTAESALGAFLIARHSHEDQVVE